MPPQQRSWPVPPHASPAWQVLECARALSRGGPSASLHVAITASARCWPGMMGTGVDVDVDTERGELRGGGGGVVLAVAVRGGDPTLQRRGAVREMEVVHLDRRAVDGEGAGAWMAVLLGVRAPRTMPTAFWVVVGDVVAGDIRVARVAEGTSAGDGAVTVVMDLVGRDGNVVVSGGFTCPGGDHGGTPQQEFDPHLLQLVDQLHQQPLLLRNVSGGRVFSTILPGLFEFDVATSPIASRTLMTVIQRCGSTALLALAPGHGAWTVRRQTLHVSRPPRVGSPLKATTWVSSLTKSSLELSTELRDWTSGELVCAGAWSVVAHFPGQVGKRKQVAFHPCARDFCGPMLKAVVSPHHGNHGNHGNHGKRGGNNTDQAPTVSTVRRSFPFETRWDDCRPGADGEEEQGLLDMMRVLTAVHAQCVKDTPAPTCDVEWRIEVLHDHVRHPCTLHVLETSLGAHVMQYEVTSTKHRVVARAWVEVSRKESPSWWTAAIISPPLSPPRPVPVPTSLWELASSRLERSYL